MLTLAIDTSTEWGSVALARDQELLQYLQFRGPLRHSSTLFPALAKMRLHTHKIERIIVGLGPGSFASIRVSLATAHGIAIGHGAQVFGIYSTRSIGHQFANEKRLGIFADAKRGEVFCTVYEEGKLTSDTYLVPYEKLATELPKFTYAVSAAPILGVTRRAFPQATDFLRFLPGAPELIGGTALEPIHLRDPLYMM
jgi:tRNA threonylcarbamoyladenosine biosynthesis protein TsaB